MITLRTEPTLPTNIWTSGELSPDGDLRLDPHSITDLLFINWRNCTMHAEREQIKCESYYPISLRKKHQIRSLFQKGVTTVKIMLIYHDHIYLPKTFNEMANDYIQNVSIAAAPFPPPPPFPLA